MLCEYCKTNEAVIFIEESSGSGTRTFRLCKKCAAECGIYKEGQLHLDIENLIKQSDIEEKLEDDFLPGDIPVDYTDETDSLKCPRCGLTEDELLSSDGIVRAGCPECYKAFSPLLKPMLGELHRGKTHNEAEKGSAKTREEKTLDDRRGSSLKELQKELAHAVGKEAYEKAAELRDQITELKNNNRSDF